MTTDQLQHFNDLHDAIERLRDDVTDLNKIREEDDWKARIKALREEQKTSALRVWALHYLSLLHRVAEETSAIFQLRELLEEKQNQFENL